jgi:AcrR family transcriptional regulator
MAEVVPTRRQRVRDATIDEITSVAGELVAREGAAGLSLRAVARTMGMAPSALYRYYPSRDALLTALIVEAYDSVGQAVEDAVAAAPRDRSCSAILAATHAFRSWAVRHPHEFGLIYGTPVPGYTAPAQIETPAMRTPTALLALLRKALDDEILRLPLTDDELPPSLTGPLQEVVEHKNHAFSRVAVAAAMQFWAMMLGLVSSALFGHLPEPLGTGDDAAFFDFVIRRNLLAIGVLPESLDRSVSPIPS